MENTSAQLQHAADGAFAPPLNLAFGALARHSLFHDNAVRRLRMKLSTRSSLVFAALVISLPSMAQAQSLARPDLILKEIVSGMPKGERQEVRVLTASFKPGDKTAFHTHRFPVTVFVLDGAFTLELEGRAPVVVKAGQAFVEPPNVKMTGYNRSSTELLRVVIFYASDPDAPFLDPIQ
jgi:quercetin dioxygenase-like cupin family protein